MMHIATLLHVLFLFRICTDSSIFFPLQVCEQLDDEYAAKCRQMQVGEEKAKAAVDQAKRFSKGVYFIGKVVWAKGYTELLDLMKQHKDASKEDVHVSNTDARKRSGL